MVPFDHVDVFITSIVNIVVRYPLMCSIFISACSIFISCVRCKDSYIVVTQHVNMNKVKFNKSMYIWPYIRHEMCHPSCNLHVHYLNFLFMRAKRIGGQTKHLPLYLIFIWNIFLKIYENIWSPTTFVFIARVLEQIITVKFEPHFSCVNLI